jgi:hypothetical protein
MVSGRAGTKDIDVASKLWGKNIAVLKGKTAISKSTLVARDYVNVPTELSQLHKKVVQIASAHRSAI